MAEHHKRDPWFDNARWLAGTLVVLVHVFGRYRDDVFAVEWLWFGTWSYRIPLFALLVGLFSTATPVAKDYRQLVSRILVPLVLLTAAHALISYLEGDGIPTPWEPQYTLWFLYAIIVWRLILPFIAKMRWPLLIAVLISLAMTSGAFEADPFGLVRMAANLPFVVVGWWLRTNSDWLRRRSPAKTALALVFVIGVGYYSWQLVAADALVASDFAGLTPLTSPELLLARLLILLIGLLGAFAILYLMPRRKVFAISTIGGNGYQIYLLHGIILTLIGLVVDWPTADELGVGGLVAFLVMGIAFAAVLGTNLVREGLDAVLRPIGRIIGSSK